MPDLFGWAAPAENTELIRATIAHHAAEALRRSANPEGAMRAFGDSDWAMARYHLHVAQALRQLADVDPASAVTFIREKALAAIAGPGKAA